MYVRIPVSASRSKVISNRMATRRLAARLRFTASPRHRIYLCNWFVKIVKPGKEQPKDQVQCHVPIK